jgi:hypothetical protein
MLIQPIDDFILVVVLALVAIGCGADAQRPAVDPADPRASESPTSAPPAALSSAPYAAPGSAAPTSTAPATDPHTGHVHGDAGGKH